jgi:hypothetical protein
LTEDENNDLAELKQKMVLLYAFLQDAKLLSARPMKPSMHGFRRESSSPAEKLNQNVEDEVAAKEENAEEEPTPEKQPDEPEVVVVERSPTQFPERERVVIEDSPRRNRTRSPSLNKQPATRDK